MAARVIHFGVDDCHRVTVLQGAGYDVKESLSLDRLRIDLKTERDVDAVFISEDDRSSTERAAELVRRHCEATLILFRRTQRELDEKKFDRVYSSLTPPQNWLLGTAELIEMKRAI
jgi:hypothetical protein